MQLLPIRVCCFRSSNSRGCSGSALRLEREGCASAEVVVVVVVVVATQQQRGGRRGRRRLW